MSPHIPQTDSVQALAEFWDTHEVTDFADDLEEVNEPVFEPGEVVQIHLQPIEIEAVKQVAQAQGIIYEELIRGWVLEKVRSA
ncbi:MAG: CopG family antitoxin [Leptolyngbyaceae cyanobacterium]